MSSGMASHCTNLRESPSTTSQQASAAYERHDLPPRSAISRSGLNSERAICCVSTPSMYWSRSSAAMSSRTSACVGSIGISVATDLRTSSPTAAKNSSRSLAPARSRSARCSRCRRPRGRRCVPRTLRAAFPERGLGDAGDELLIGEGGVDRRARCRASATDELPRRADSRRRCASSATATRGASVNASRVVVAIAGLVDRGSPTGRAPCRRRRARARTRSAPRRCRAAPRPSSTRRRCARRFVGLGGFGQLRAAVGRFRARAAELVIVPALALGDRARAAAEGDACRRRGSAG